MFSDPGSFCDQLSSQQLGQLGAESHKATLNRGGSITNEELLIWPVIAISSGVLSLQHLLEDGRRTIAALFMPGDIVDLRGISARNRGQLIALGKTVICRLSQREFEAAFNQNIDAQKSAWSNLRNQTSRAMDHAADLAKKQALEKLASFIFECRHRQANRGAGHVVDIPVRRIDLADYLGMQPETVSRCFREMEERGIISIHSMSNLTILDTPTLRRIANGDKHTQDLRNTGRDHLNTAQQS